MLTAILDFLRNELIDRLYHHIATEALIPQLLLCHVVQLMFSDSVAGSVSSSMRSLTWRRHFLASKVLRGKMHRVQTHMGRRDQKR